ncbi:YopX family protein [Bacillus pumilus]|uniref:YopX family protein n=1 Tax=Bacillus pumilus TaxID=1408 RepID=UPI003D749EC1
MREIKFRGWYGSRLGMMTPTFNGDINKIFAEKHGDYMQFTGLKDSKGNEIYEGDIILITYDKDYSEHPYYLGEVKFRCDTDYPAFDLLPWVDCDMNALSWLKSKCDPSVKSYEVVGNIYENPKMVGRLGAQSEDLYN